MSRSSSVWALWAGPARAEDARNSHSSRSVRGRALRQRPARARGDVAAGRQRGQPAADRDRAVPPSDEPGPPPRFATPVLQGVGDAEGVSKWATRPRQDEPVPAMPVVLEPDSFGDDEPRYLLVDYHRSPPAGAWTVSQAADGLKSVTLQATCA